MGEATASTSEIGCPVVVLLVGLTGSGKTTYAQRLESEGMTRLSVDEEVFARHGRYGVDYEEREYFEKEAPVVAETKARMIDLVRSGHDVVVDYGLWRREQRVEWKRLVESAGGRWRLLYFPVERDELLRRLHERNQRADANALTVDETALDQFFMRFDVPQGEGEEVI